MRTNDDKSVLTFTELFARHTGNHQSTKAQLTYWQGGAAMGSALSTVIVNLHMGHSDNAALNKAA
jgi:hypothetical protein